MTTSEKLKTSLPSHTEYRMTIESEIKHVLASSGSNEAAKQQILALLDRLIREHDKEATRLESEVDAFRANYERLIKKT